MNALELLGFAFPQVLIAFLLSKFLKNKYIASGILFVGFLIIARFIRIAMTNNLLAGSLFEFVIYFSLILILYEGKISKKVITFSLIIFASLVSEFLTFLTAIALFSYDLSDFTSLVLPTIPIMIIGNLIFVTVILLLVIIWQMITKDIVQNQMPLFMFFPLSQVYPLGIILLTAINYKNNSLFTVLIILIFLCIFANIGLVIAMKRLTQFTASHEKLAFYEKQLEIQLRHYQQLSEYNSIVKRYKHDMKNHIQTVYSLMENNDLYHAKKYTDELAQSIDNSVSIQFCDNLIIDTLLQNKYSLGKSGNIRMDIIVQLGNETGVNDLHLGSIFSNLIDNALEACKKISDPKVSPYIIVKCYEKAGFLIINVTNSKQGDILLPKDKKHIISKKDTPDRGLGLTIVDSIVKMYNGEFYVKHTKSEFEAIVALTLGQKHSVG